MGKRKLKQQRVDDVYEAEELVAEEENQPGRKFDVSGVLPMYLAPCFAPSRHLQEQTNTYNNALLVLYSFFVFLRTT